MRTVLFLTALLPALCAAQISTLRHDLSTDGQIQDCLTRLRSLVLFGYPDGSRFGGGVSRAVDAVYAWQMVQVARARVTHEGFNAMPESRDAWRDRFWIFKWLGETLSKELTEQGVAMSNYYAMVEEIKKGLAKAGIVVNDPFVRFSDVPQGHWADGAIHALRRAGIVTGYPDNTFRN